MRDPFSVARLLALGSGRAGLAAAFGVALLCSSCGNTDHLPVHRVHGQVLVDGRPASNALVIFHPLGDGSARELRPVGHVGTDGTFILTTYAQRDGAPA